MNVNPGVKGFAACPHAGLAAPSPMIYALIWECLFLPGDHMGPCLHIIFVFAFASLPSLLPPSKWFSFLLKQFILAVAKGLSGSAHVQTSCDFGGRGVSWGEKNE